MALANPDKLMNLSKATVKNGATEDELKVIAFVKVNTSSFENVEI